ncbi:hypothetical protein T08_15753 [Trichinella sp. T8]|nr:hypothetical protein T08_15753 [Trichinella sp. T8]
MSSASMGRSACPHWHLGMFAALRVCNMADEVLKNVSNTADEMLCI